MRSLLVAAAFAAIAAGAAAPVTGGTGTNPRCDRNRNGVPDSVDIARGTACDTNDNGVIDLWDPDTTVSRQRSRWRNWSETPDTSYFRAEYMPNGTVTIHYTVPPGGGRVRLEVFGPDSSRVATVISHPHSSGSYECMWSRARNDGIMLGDGLYLLHLRVDDRRYVQPIEWALARR